MEKDQLFYKAQSGFKKGLNMETVLAKTTKDILSILDEGGTVAFVLPDLFCF